MKRFQQICLGFFLMAAPLWAQQVENNLVPAGQTETQDAGDRMQAPPPVSGQTYPTAFAGEERSNYLRGGVAFTSAYTDNAVGPVNGVPVSDISYYVTPTITLDETTSRLHSVLSYAPGFTFYEREGSRNEADQNAAVDLTFSLSPHVTLNAKDTFQRTSNFFNQPDPVAAGAVSGSTQAANFSVISPVAEQLRNFGSVGVTYQFARNSMVGASGTFSNLHYPDSSEVTGLYDSASQGGSVFDSWRISKVNTLGVTYQYQRLVASPAGGTSETQTHAVMAFYTLAPDARFSISFFGGPQYSDTVQPPIASLGITLPATKSWTPAVGASFGWQGRLTSFAMSYSHIISGGGGLVGAVHLDSVTTSIRQQITRSLSGSIAGSYAQNKVIGSLLPGNSNGHSLFGTVSLQEQIFPRLSLQAGYSRLHQDYSNVAVISTVPDTNREFISLSWQISHAIGR
jgi:hypothetical protein